MLIQTCCFTGHRPQSFPLEIQRGRSTMPTAEIPLEASDHPGCQTGWCEALPHRHGLGVDTWAAEIVLSLRKRWSLTLEAVIPCKGQDARWPSECRERYQSILKQCDKVTLLQDSYTPDCFDKRNRYMIDHSNLVIAVWNGSPSGTGNTVVYAKSKRKLVREITP